MYAYYKKIRRLMKYKIKENNCCCYGFLSVKLMWQLVICKTAVETIYYLNCCIGYDIDIKVYMHSYNYIFLFALYSMCLLKKEGTFKVTA